MALSNIKPAWLYACSTALLIGSGVSQANTVTSGNGAATAELTIRNDQGSSYCAQVTIQNNSDQTIRSWQLGINTNQSQIENLRRGNLSNGTITGKFYNRRINPDTSVNIRFCATATDPKNYLATLDSLTIMGGGSVNTNDSDTITDTIPNTNEPTTSVPDTDTDTNTPSNPTDNTNSPDQPIADIIPNATSSGWPYCRSSSSDPDGDGWGWENSYSCIVHTSAADSGAGNFAYCVIGETKQTLCSTDNGSWGNEKGAICLSRSLCPGMNTSSQQPMRNKPINAKANATTQSVYSYLQSIWGKQMLSGQMDLTWQDNIDMSQRVMNDTGKAPALMGYDFMNYGLYWNGISGITQTQEAINYWQRGGLVTFTWHWRDPNAADGVVGEFYSEDTSFQIPIANGELDKNSAAYANIESDIQLIAAELKTLQDAGVTVLWRPLHEASGGWFWWGRTDRTDDVPAAYAQVVLWRHLYQRLTHDYGLNNLLWVWNGQNGAWYPGDDYADIVSVDLYDGAQNYASQAGPYALTAAYPQQTKMVALSENSNIPDPDKMAKENVNWLFFMVWNDVDTAEGVTDSSNFWTGEYYNTNSHKKHVYQHERVITLDELPKF